MLYIELNRTHAVFAAVFVFEKKNGYSLTELRREKEKMSDQNQDFSKESHRDSDPTAAQSMPHLLHSTAINGGTRQPTTRATPLFGSSKDQSSKCGCGDGSMVRLPPSSSFTAPQQEPSSSIPIDGVCTQGFTKLPLPSIFSPEASPVLRRTASAPISSPGPKNFTVDQASNATARNFLNRPSPPVTSTVNSVAPSPSAPLFRTVSDPTYVSYPVAATATNSPPRPPQAARKLMLSSPSNGLGEAALNIRAKSPVTKINEMKDRLRDMTKWCNAVIKEGEEEDVGSEKNDHLPKVDESVPESQETEGAAPGEEAVWVERRGNCLILHFKCPCTKGYQILLCGNNCYYKLT